jgi:3-oxoacyl-[acyl-carrier-protein] synthase III
MTRYSQLVACKGALPEKNIHNHDLEKSVDTSHQWIMERTGIESRQVIDQETTVSLAAQAAQSAINDADILPTQIGLIVVATCTPDQVFPSVACAVQHHLGCGPGLALDVNAACSGFMYALSTADLYIKHQAIDYALVIGVDTLSQYLDWADRKTCVLFGDGAGAVVLKSSERPGLKHMILGADGQYGKHLYVTAHRSEQKSVICMQGQEVFKLAVKRLKQVVTDLLAQANTPASAVDWLIPHQANIRIIEATAKSLGMPMAQVITTIAQHANTSAASIPLAMSEAIHSGKIKTGDLCLLEAFGAGFTWGGALVQWDGQSGETQ